MGLFIRGKNCEYAYSYSGLHKIRYLALIACGLPYKYNEVDTYKFFNGNRKDIMPRVEAFFSPDAMDTMTHTDLDVYFMKVGYFFPNLMLHSDCNGSYTKTGKVCINDNLDSGNSLNLRKELKYLLNNKEVQKIEKMHNYTWRALNDLYNVVCDCINNGTGRVMFS